MVEESVVLQYVLFFISRVRLAINRKTQEAVAVKIVNHDKLAGNKDSLKKEVCLSALKNVFVR